MDKLELEKIVSKHEKWVRDEEGGEHANLSDADLPEIIKVENLFTKIKAAIKNAWAHFPTPSYWD